MATADIKTLFTTLDTYTDNQLRMVAAYCRDLAAERRTARQMAPRSAQNDPKALKAVEGGTELRTKPA